jgi:tetratricopeptide (TPR) repeat protein
MYDPFPGAGNQIRLKIMLADEAYNEAWSLEELGEKNTSLWQSWMRSAYSFQVTAARMAEVGGAIRNLRPEYLYWRAAEYAMEAGLYEQAIEAAHKGLDSLDPYDESHEARAGRDALLETITIVKHKMTRLQRFWLWCREKRNVLIFQRLQRTTGAGTRPVEKK